MDQNNNPTLGQRCAARLAEEKHALATTGRVMTEEYVAATIDFELRKHGIGEPATSPASGRGSMEGLAEIIKRNTTDDQFHAIVDEARALVGKG